MEPQMAAAHHPLPHHHHQPKAANLARSFTKLLRRKRGDGVAAAAVGEGEREPGVADAAAAAAAASVAGDEYGCSVETAAAVPSLSKLKLSGNLGAAYSLDAFFRNAAERKVPAAAAVGGPQTSPQVAPDVAKDSLLANLFAGVSAVKAAYAQLQLAQCPYDAEAIQAADAALVAELTKLSDTKRRYLRDPAAAAKNAAAAGHTALFAHAEEQRYLLKTYQITARKLEGELRAKEAEADCARSSLTAELRAERAMEARLHPGRTLASLDELHLSGLNPTHFLTALRHTVKSIRSFSKSMLNSMQSAGWDLGAAAAAVHPGVPLRRAGDAKFVFESYVAMKMFANFHRRDFNFSFLDEREFYDRRRFFEEFTELKTAPASAFLDVRNARWGGFGKFLRAKYLSLVHAKMETAFFGRLEQRGIVSAGPGFPESSWFAEFAEMARRVWLLHCLFYAFDGGAEEDGASIFQVRMGARFSEVYMESVSDGRSDEAAAEERVVGFTVVPGFRVGRTMIQCRVYLCRPGRRP
ncbi:protein GRAVITROPIC IN THE LIGHT 1 [Oryza brachyantha]|uniref:protein GRAVITROPIC IN THE LIGHT 1 n=1 Tax=Oryza brachyantha TaxID=4533 RepID=UPI001ADAF091|nr:protein GRAVITROPIC IN THE LIGHT 1 [Oryza brachyantha]